MGFFDLTTLCECEKNVRYKIVKIVGDERERFLSLGFGVGSEIVKSNEIKTCLLVEIKNSKFAIDKKTSRDVYVERV